MSEEVESLRQISSQTTVEWQIKNFSALMRTCNYVVTSPKFWASNANWELQLLLNAHKSKPFISLFLHLISEDDISACVSFSIKVNNTVLKTSKFKNNFTEEEKEEDGCNLFYEKSKLLEHLKCNSSDDTVTIVCSIYYMAENPNDVAIFTEIVDIDSVKILTKNLEEILLSSKMADIKLKVQSVEYPAHKAILAARSPVFLSMFEHEMAESRNGEVDINDCDADCFKIFLVFLYTGNMGNLSVNQCVGVYKIADKYFMEDLKAKCRIWITQNLNIDFILEVLELAITHEETKLLEKTMLFFTMNAIDIFKTNKWREFMLNKSLMANNILREMANMSTHIAIKPKSDPNSEDT